MEAEELEVQESTSAQTETLTSVNEETKQTLDSLPRIEDLRRSEKEIKTKSEIEGVTKVEQNSLTQDRVFKKKVDEKKVFYKKRLKIVTSVSATVAVLLLAFVGINIFTLASLDKQINTNTETIQTQQQQIELLEQTEGNVPVGEYTISLNEPRDYSEDKKDLTWLDKITILFRNLFG